jgi:hypothetical protein
MLVRREKRDEGSMKVTKKEGERNSLENTINISCLETNHWTREQWLAMSCPRVRRRTTKIVSETRILNSAQTAITHHVPSKLSFDHSKKENL